MIASKPEKKPADFTPLPSFVSIVSGIDANRRQWTAKPDEDVDAEYGRLKAAGSIQCSGEANVDKETKIDRILSIIKFPGSGIEFRPVKINRKDMKTLEDDWDYSNRNNIEVARMFCLDPATNDVNVTKTRAEGTAGSVAPPRGACRADYPGSIEIGGVHTHPPFYDKPLESLGDVLAFGAGEEVFSCTVTKWGVGCLNRNREPLLVFNIPKTKKDKQPVYDANGMLVYDVKSDVVDWPRSVDMSRRDLMNDTFLASMGEANDKIIQSLATVPWFKPAGVSKPSIGVVSAPFPFGAEKSERHRVGNLYCESFVDIVGGRNAKLRTVCNDFVKKEKDKNYKRDPGFYVESNIKMAALPFYSPGFPTNVYIDEKIAGDVEKIKLTRENSKFWNYSDDARPGYHETDADRTARVLKMAPKKETISAGAIFVKRGKDGAGKTVSNKECEYLLLPLPEGPQKILGKPAGLYCHEKSSPATSDTCILVSTR